MLWVVGWECTVNEDSHFLSLFFRLYFTLCADCIYRRYLKKKKTFFKDFDSSGIFALDFVCVWVNCNSRTMPVQAPQWTDFLSCPICTQTFDETIRKPISLGCGHTVCKMCLNKLHRKACPFDQTTINTDIELLPVNSALLQLVGAQVSWVTCYIFKCLYMCIFLLRETD